MSEQNSIEWRAIPGWEGFYEVSNSGQVRGVERLDSRGHRVVSRLLTPTINKANGYPQVGLQRSGARVVWPLHKAVMLAFVGPRPDSHDIRHLDGDVTNNRLGNLAYGTRRENNIDAVLHGTNVNAAKTHCLRGHEFNEINTYYKSEGGRQCRPCRAINRKRYQERKSAA